MRTDHKRNDFIQSPLCYRWMFTRAQNVTTHHTGNNRVCLTTALVTFLYEYTLMKDENRSQAGRLYTVTSMLSMDVHSCPKCYDTPHWKQSSVSDNSTCNLLV